MGRYCAPLLVDLFLYSYETELIQGFLRNNKTKLDISLNFTHRYIDAALSLNNATLNEHLDQIYSSELEIKETTDSTKSASFLDLFLEIYQKRKLVSKIYDKRDDFNFHIYEAIFLLPLPTGFMFRS